MILDNLPNLLNMDIRYIKIHLRAFEKTFRVKTHSQNRVGEVHGFGSKMPIFEANFVFKCF